MRSMTWHALKSGWMQRFLRLHRPFLIRSIESEEREYQMSYDTCLEFSKAIIRNHKYVIDRYSMTGELEVRRYSAARRARSRSPLTRQPYRATLCRYTRTTSRP
jgi:hypothetical protein